MQTRRKRRIKQNKLTWKEREREIRVGVAGDARPTSAKLDGIGDEAELDGWRATEGNEKEPHEAKPTPRINRMKAGGNSER